MANMRHTQAATVASPAFRGMVKASVMVIAYAVLKDTAAPNYEQRAGLSRTLLYAMTPAETMDSIVERFCWWAVNQQPVINAYGAAGGDVAQIPDEVVDAAVVAFWDDASGVMAVE